MNCNFVTRGGLQAVEPINASSQAPSNSIENALSFEMATLSKPIFASLSAAFPPRQRAAGMPLFELARVASGPMVEQNLRVIRIKGDGRCMFRSIALGLARNHGKILGPAAEEQEADYLRLAVAEALCRTPKRRSEFNEAVLAVQAEDTLQNYCKKIMAPTFWGGEPELLILSKMLKVPIYVYLAQGSTGYAPIQKYGEKYAKAGKDWSKRRPVRILFVHGNHYDLLVR